MIPDNRTLTRNDDGAATVLVLSMVGVLCFVLVGLSAAAALFHAQRRAQAAADLAALAGAVAMTRGEGVCPAARSVASSNGARLEGCAEGASDVRVVAAVPGPRWLGREITVRAEARAGQAPP